MAARKPERVGESTRLLEYFYGCKTPNISMHREHPQYGRRFESYRSRKRQLISLPLATRLVAMSTSSDRPQRRQYLPGFIYLHSIKRKKRTNSKTISRTRSPAIHLSFLTVSTSTTPGNLTVTWAAMSLLRNYLPQLSTSAKAIPFRCTSGARCRSLDAHVSKHLHHHYCLLLRLEYPEDVVNIELADLRLVCFHVRTQFGRTLQHRARCQESP